MSIFFPVPRPGLRKKMRLIKLYRRFFFLTLICAISSRIVSHDAPLCFVAITLWDEVFVSSSYALILTLLSDTLWIRKLTSNYICIWDWTACWISSMNFFERYSKRSVLSLFLNLIIVWLCNAFLKWMTRSSQTDTCYPVLKDWVGVYIDNAAGKK